MRHIAGLIIGIVTTPILLYGAGQSYVVAFDVSSRIVFDRPAITRVVPYIALMMVIGAVVGVLLCARRLSPIAASLPGLVLVALTLGYLVQGWESLLWIPQGPGRAWQGFQTLTATGIFALLGVAMLVPSFVPGRWRTPSRQSQGPGLGGHRPRQDMPPGPPGPQAGSRPMTPIHGSYGTGDGVDTH